MNKFLAGQVGMQNKNVLITIGGIYLIQLINYSGKNTDIKNSKIIISKISEPRSLDEFKINIIDLNDVNIWRNHGVSYASVNCINDLGNLGNMVRNSLKTEIAIVLPQDLTFFYCYGRRGNIMDYTEQIKLKNIMYEVRENVLNELLDIFNMEIIFEPTRTKMDEMDIEASFYFMAEGHSDRNIVLTLSIGSEKITTVSVDDIVITTLNLQTENEILAFLRHIKLIEREIEIPSWIKDIKMFNDIVQEDIIRQNKETIAKAKEKIYASQDVLDKNSEYKSILYTSGDDLVDVVREILGCMLDYDLSNFVDEGNEDFRIEFNDVTIIGEIKGVTSNVKSEHVSQLDVHKQKYSDRLQKEGTQEFVKSILIINHQRKNELGKRQPINEEQIKLAERNESLIIETYTLLKLFENFRNSKFSPVQFKRILKENKGLLKA